MSSSAPCPGCGVLLPQEDGPTHAYMLASPACWRLYGEVMAREYASQALMEVHFLTVDAFAVQHPGGPEDRRARQSVWIHLAGLKAFLRDGRSREYRYDLLRELTQRSDFAQQPAHQAFTIVAADLAASVSEAKHIEGVRNWADAALRAYEQADPGLHAKLDALSS